MEHITVERLHEILSELENMPALPRAGTPEAIAQHAEWMKTHERIRELVYRAEAAALLSVPPDVLKALNAIYVRKCTLLHLPYRSYLPE